MSRVKITTEADAGWARTYIADRYEVGAKSDDYNWPWVKFCDQEPGNPKPWVLITVDHFEVGAYSVTTAETVMDLLHPNEIAPNTNGTVTIETKEW